MVTIIALTPDENFIQFLDPELCTIEETHEYRGLRTLSMEYKFQDLSKDKRLFKKGNKLWVTGHSNPRDDCLYVIDTEVTNDVYQENSFKFEIEEVLVELNFAPLFTQLDLSKSCFDVSTTNGKVEVTVNWNALNGWFGKYFNIGVVQKCISTYANKISLNGSMTLMSLLRYIEEETGNVFVTRYEKDLITNTIHRYLDFLNPINVSEDWILNLEYDFITELTGVVYDTNGNFTTEDKNWELKPYEDGTAPESLSEEEGDEQSQAIGTELASQYNSTDDEIESIYAPKFVPITNLNPSDIVFRITKNGEVYNDGTNDYIWSNTDAGFSTSNPSCIISLVKDGANLGVDVNSKSFVVASTQNNVEPTESFLSVSADPDLNFNSIIPDDSYFEIYDTLHEKIVFRTQINNQIGTVHDEILNFGRNVENVTYETDETETYTAVSPILSCDNGDLSYSNMTSLLTAWKNLSVRKGEVIPMIVQKMNITGTDANKCTQRTGTATSPNKSAVQILEKDAPYTLTSNYYARPYAPNDNTESDNKSYEYYRATAYWKAPYTKYAGEMFIETPNILDIEYCDIHLRPDIRDERGAGVTPKLGTTETSDDNVYAIYNQVVNYLKEHETPNIKIEVDVANLQNGQFNEYMLHDKVYLKLPDSQELVTARVTKVTKDAHDIAKNSIELSNYTSKNTYKTITKDTYIDAQNVSFKYPNTKTLTATLKNAEDDNDILANKLLSFTLYSVENGSSTPTGKVYTKKTQYNGTASIILDLDPGDYELDITFGGDELYTETSITIDVNVSGTIQVPATMTTKTTKAKTTKKTSTKKTVKTYWSKCGHSLDSKQIISIAKPSASNSDMQKYKVKSTQLYKTIFKNWCPECGKTGKLVFDGGKKNKCVKSAGAKGRGYKINVPEHEITCNACDSDFDGVTGLEKDSNHSTRLKMIEKPVKSTESEFAKLTKGQLFHSNEAVTVVSKNNTNTKNRKTVGSGIDSTVKKTAESIVKNKTGQAAAQELTYWVAKKISYGFYTDFKKAPKTVLSSKKGNCCDQARLLAQMMDAVGLTQYYKIQYIYTCCGSYNGQTVGHVFLKLTTKKTGKSRFVDPCKKASPWGNHCNYGSTASGTLSNYPKLPF